MAKAQIVIGANGGGSSLPSELPLFYRGRYYAVGAFSQSVARNYRYLKVLSSYNGQTITDTTVQFMYFQQGQTAFTTINISTTDLDLTSLSFSDNPPYDMVAFRVAHSADNDVGFAVQFHN